MKLKAFTTGKKLAIGFGCIIFLTLAIVIVSFISINEIEQKNNDYKVVINAEKYFLKANSLMESYLNTKDSVEYIYCSVYLDSSINNFNVLKYKLKDENLLLFVELFAKINRYKALMQQNHSSITKQKEIYGDRRKMRILFTDELKKHHIARDHKITYYFNQARLNAVYLLSSNDLVYYNETNKNIDLAIAEAQKINCLPIVKALNDYMVSVKDNYDLALKIKETKDLQLGLGRELLDKSDKLTDNLDAYQQIVRKSTKIFLLVFSIISIILSVVISQIIVAYITKKQQIIEEKNKTLLQQSDSLAAINTLLEERQQQVEEQSEELMAQRDQLSQLNATKDKLFSIIAHDLKNPFNSILGFSDLLLKNIRVYPLEKIETQVGYIRDSTRFTYDMLDNLLQWSRAQRGIIGFEPELMKFSEHLNHELKNLRQQALRKEITIDVLLAGEEKLIFADSHLISTVVRNLISNAIKFSNKSSTILITMHFNEENFEFSVKDNGLGMTQEKKDRLFNITCNATTRGTEGEKGTGLGLLLCADFIEKHKGKLAVESEINQGSRFYFSIPYDQEK